MKAVYYAEFSATGGIEPVAFELNCDLGKQWEEMLSGENRREGHRDCGCLRRGLIVDGSEALKSAGKMV